MDFFLLRMFDNAPLLISLLAGILTFISPCILPLIPPYMSYISGISIEAIQNKSFKTKIFIFRKALFFVLGFSSIFILFCLSLNNIIGRILANPIINYISAAIIITFGIHFLGLIKINFLYKAKLLNIDNILYNKIIQSTSFLPQFILGIGFALGWSPCVSPILSSIMILSSKDTNNGIYLAIAYAIGLGIPFLITALTIDKLFNILHKIKKYYRIIEIANGLLLIIIGIIIAIGGLDKLVIAIQ